MCGTSKALAVTALGVILSGALGTPGQAAEMTRGPANVVAEPSVGAGRVDWLPTVEYERMMLTVTGPKNFFIREEREAGQPLSLSLFDKDGERLSDGIYTYELRPVPRLDRETRDLLARARDGGVESLLAQLHKAGRLPEHPLVQSGYLTVRGGSFVATDLSARAAANGLQASKTPTASLLPKTTVTPPLIVPGDACIGDGCSGDSDAGSPLKLKSSLVRLKFEDVPDGISYSRDWALQANDGLGGSDRFFISDLDAGTSPFSIAGNAPDSALYVASNGNLGLGTSVPAKDVHVISGNTPTLRLEQDGSGGLTAQTWDVAGNETGFSVRDITNAAKLPLRILPGAPTSSIHVAANGNVGIGTATPSNSLHLRRTDGTALAVVEEASTTAAARTIMKLINSGAVWVELQDTSAYSGAGDSWVFRNQNDQFQVDETGHTGTELRLDRNGNLTVTGSVITATTTYPDFVFEPDYPLMPMAELAKYVAEKRHLPNIPSAGEVGTSGGVNLSELQIKLLEKVEELTLYTLAQQEHIQQLNARNAELEAHENDLRSQNLEIHERLAALERALGSATATPRP